MWIDSDRVSVSPADRRISSGLSERDNYLGEHPSTLPNYDLHNHTVYCGHADDSATVESIINRANEVGLDYIGFSEHVMAIPDLITVRAMEMDIAPRRAASRAKILFGVEMDIDPQDADGGWVVPDVDCDYVILSAHDQLPIGVNLGPGEARLSQELQRRRLARRWLHWYGKAIANGGFDVLGHPLREPINMGLLSLYDPDLFQTSLSVFQPAIERGAAFELNNAYLAYLATTSSFAGYVQLVRFLKDRGMKFARGSDSHGVARVGASDGISIVAEQAGLVISDWIDPAQLGRHRG